MLQALFQFLPVEDAVFSFQFPYVLGRFSRVVFRVVRLGYDVLLLFHQCNFHLVVVYVPNVYHDAVEGIIEVVGPMPGEFQARQ